MQHSEGNKSIFSPHLHLSFIWIALIWKWHLESGIVQIMFNLLSININSRLNNHVFQS